MGARPDMEVASIGEFGHGLPGCSTFLLTFYSVLFSFFFWFKSYLYPRSRLRRRLTNSGSTSAPRPTRGQPVQLALTDMDFLKSAVASAIAKGSSFPYSLGDRVDVSDSLWSLHNATKRVCSSTPSVLPKQSPRYTG